MGLTPFLTSTFRGMISRNTNTRLLVLVALTPNILAQVMAPVMFMIIYMAFISQLHKSVRLFPAQTHQPVFHLLPLPFSNLHRRVCKGVISLPRLLLMLPQVPQLNLQGGWFLKLDLLLQPMTSMLHLTPLNLSVTPSMMLSIISCKRQEKVGRKELQT